MSNKTREAIEKELDSNIPRDAVSSRSGGGPKQLSYLETWYVIDRLNKVFGNMGWDCETIEMVLVSESGAMPAYRAKVRITVSCPAYDENNSVIGFRNVVREGTGWGSDKSKMNAHEMACKEAESDALKRAAMKLGISMGLGLYDKSGDYVEDAPKAQKVAPSHILPSELPKLQAALEKDIKGVSIDPKTAVLITKASLVILAKAGADGTPERAAAKTTLQSDVKAKYGVDSIKELTETQARELLANLEGRANGK